MKKKITVLFLALAFIFTAISISPKTTVEAATKTISPVSQGGTTDYGKKGKWIKVNKKWKFRLNNGKGYLVDWKLINGKYYFLDSVWGATNNNLSDGNMVEGWVYYDDFMNSWMNAGNAAKKCPRGTARDRYQKSSGYWAYCVPGTGAMATGWKQLGGSWYFFKPDGNMTIGWRKISGKWYYFTTNGNMVFSTRLKIGGKYYNFNKDGVCTNP